VKNDRVAQQYTGTGKVPWLPDPVSLYPKSIPDSDLIHNISKNSSLDNPLCFIIERRVPFGIGFL
jgi:hypothetical protein